MVFFRTMNQETDSAAWRHLSEIANQRFPKLIPVLQHNGKIRHRSSRESLFVFLARTVVGQQLSKAAASTIWARIERAAEGGCMEQFFQDSRTDNLRELGLAASKTKSIKSIASAVGAGLLNGRTLRKMQYEEVVETVTSHSGLGPWSADMVAIFYIGLPDVFPVTDVAVNNGLRHMSESSELDSQDIADMFAPYRSYLAKHLWRGIDSGILK